MGKFILRDKIYILSRVLLSFFSMRQLIIFVIRTVWKISDFLMLSRIILPWRKELPSTMSITMEIKYVIIESLFRIMIFVSIEWWIRKLQKRRKNHMLLEFLPINTLILKNLSDIIIVFIALLQSDLSESIWRKQSILCECRMLNSFFSKILIIMI